MDTFIPNILQDPRQNFFSFQRVVIASYGGACQGILRHGLLGFIVTDVQWAALDGNSEPNEDPALPQIIQLRPTLILPAQPAGNASALTIKIWERKCNDIHTMSEQLRALKMKLIASISRDDLKALHDPIFGLLNIAHTTILQQVATIHGILDSSDFVALRQILAARMDCAMSCTEIISKHRTVHDQLRDAGQPLSDFDKCHLFREAVQGMTHIRAAIDSYLIVHPLIADQVFTTLAEHVLQQAPNFAPTAGTMGYTANVSATTSSPVDMSTIFESPAFAALITRTVQAALPIHRRGRTARAPQELTVDPATRPYCFVHGYDSHKGTACRVMRDQPELHSNAKKNALTHTRIAGGSTNRL
jgi:hypothetical protein